jgi:peptidoglycan/xylan/chitin deacetylase (PgdA/CDA1 family)
MDRTIEGQWSVYGSGFDWSNITSVVFQLSSVDGSPVQVELGKLSTTPAQSEGKIAIIFDDGTTSLLSAYPTLQKNGYKASVAVIGKYSGRNFTGYLSIAQLRQLKNSGWSLVNHSYYHQDAVATYYNQNNLSGLKADILEGAYFLEQNNLDTDPNWYIYPHGTSNQAIEAVVGEYYKFARTELTAPEVYPFGNPLAVKDFVVEDTTTPQEVEAAIADANTYHLTLILTFHRIHANPGDKSGYDLSNFKQIVNYLKSTKSNVMSLNQLDASNGVPINKTKITEGRPSQLTGTISVQQEPFWKRLAKL